MRAQLNRAWRSRAPKERAIIGALAAVLAVALYLWLVQSAWQARGRIHASVMTLRAQSARLDQQALEVGRLRAEPAATVSTTDLRTLVQASIGAAGLSPALVRIDAPDADRVTVVFGALSFADWRAWVASLQAQRIRLETCRIQALSAPGMVSVTATFTAAR